MKYFTPDLWLRMQSGVSRETFLAAYDQWEHGLTAYSEEVSRIIPQDRRYLQVKRHLALMIDGHAIKVADQRGRQIDLSGPSPVYRGIMMWIEQAAPDGGLTPLPGA